MESSLPGILPGLLTSSSWVALELGRHVRELELCSSTGETKAQFPQEIFTGLPQEQEHQRWLTSAGGAPTSGVASVK